LESFHGEEKCPYIIFSCMQSRKGGKVGSNEVFMGKSKTGKNEDLWKSCDVYYNRGGGKETKPKNLKGSHDKEGRIFVCTMRHRSSLLKAEQGGHVQKQTRRLHKKISRGGSTSNEPSEGGLTIHGKVLWYGKTKLETQLLASPQQEPKGEGCSIEKVVLARRGKS